MFSLQDNQKVILGLEFADEAGNVAKAPSGAAPAWSVGDATLLTITPAVDGLTAAVAAVGPLGTTQVRCDVFGLHGLLDVEVLASDAVTIAIKPGTPDHR